MQSCIGTAGKYTSKKIYFRKFISGKFLDKTILTAVKQRYGRVNVCSKAAASRFYAITVTGVHTFHSF